MKSKRIPGFGMNQQTDLVEQWATHHAPRIFTVDTAESGLFQDSPLRSTIDLSGTFEVNIASCSIKPS